MSVVRLDGKPDELRLAAIGLGGELDQGVEWYLDIRQVLQRPVQEVAHNAAQHRLEAFS